MGTESLKDTYPPVEEQTAEHAVLIDPVAGVFAPCVHQQAAVAGYAELTVGHGRGVGRLVVVVSAHCGMLF